MEQFLYLIGGSLIGFSIALLLLKNNTNNIIEYRNDIEVYKKKRKNYKFWDLIRK